MVAGLLNEEITIKALTSTQNDFGEPVETYTAVFNTRASVRAVNGGRRDENSEVFYAHVYTMAVRSYVPVGDFDRVEWKGKDYRILNIDLNRLQNNKLLTVELVNE